MKYPIAQKLRTTNDTNGNSRQLFVIYTEKGNISKVLIDEYDNGELEIRQRWPLAVMLPTINITPMVWRGWMIDGQRRGILTHHVNG